MIYEWECRVFGINIDRIHFKIMFLPRLKCSVVAPLWCGGACHYHKLGLVVVRQTLTRQRYIDDILQPIVYPHFWAHQAAHSIFQDDNAHLHRARVVTESLAQEGTEKLQWPSKSPDMNPIQLCWGHIGRNIIKQNDVVGLDDLAHAFVDELQFLLKLVQGMAQQVLEYISIGEDTPLLTWISQMTLKRIALIIISEQSITDINWNFFVDYKVFM